MGEIFIELAKVAIATSLGFHSDFDLNKARKDYPILNEDKAVFVTLRKNPYNTLRGCIGSLEASRPLYKDIIANAKSSAFDDSRFKPLTKEEFENIKIEISILSKPKELKYKNITDLKSKIRPNIDGVVLRYWIFSATYLPTVWEVLPTFDNFFENLCQKAHLSKKCLDNHPTIFIYQATKYKEQ